MVGIAAQGELSKGIHETALDNSWRKRQIDFTLPCGNASTNRGCLVGCVVLIAVVALIGMIWAAVVINTSTTTSHARLPNKLKRWDNESY